jgi:hypothetical protein
MSPRHRGEHGERLKSSWAVDIHDLLGGFIRDDLPAPY